MAEGKLSVPAAIVIAGVLIGAGLFFGLRDRGRDAPPRGGVVEPRAAEPAASRGDRPPDRTAPPTAIPPPPVVALRERAVQEIAAALDKQRAALTEKCWKPNAGASPPPRPARWTFNFTMAPDGSQIARGVAEARGAGSPEITRCVLEALAPVSVSPTGATVVVDVPFALP